MLWATTRRFVLSCSTVAERYNAPLQLVIDFDFEIVGSNILCAIYISWNVHLLVRFVENYGCCHIYKIGA
jgi:hypothetical protein